MKALALLLAVLPTLAHASSLKSISTKVNGETVSVELTGEVESDSENEVEISAPGIRIANVEHQLWAIGAQGRYGKESNLGSPVALFCRYLVGNKKGAKWTEFRSVESSDSQVIVEDQTLLVGRGFRVVVPGASAGYSPMISGITCLK